MSAVVYPQQIEFSRFLFEVKSKHFHQYTPLARQDKGKKYFAIDDTHPLEEDPLGGQQRKALLQIEAHLVSEDPHRAGSRAVAAHDALRPDAAQQVEVLFHGSSVLSVRRPPSSSTA